MVYYKNKDFKKRSKKLLIVCTIALVIVLSVVFLIMKNYEKAPSNSHDSISQTTSTSPTAQENFTDGDEREPGSTSNESEGEGTVVDNQGADVIDTDESTWSSSKTGEIIVFTPINNQILLSGNILSGKSILNEVSFRIIDDVSGVIATGILDASSGKFSGSFSFNTTATEGRIDVYGVKENGIEFGNVEIPVRFK